MKKFIYIIPLTLILATTTSMAPDYSFKLGLLKYSGGGDWYANLETSLRNLAVFCNQNLGMNINPEQAIVEADGIAIEMVVDRSGSMRALDFKIDGDHVDRLTAIKNVAGRFIQGDEESKSKDKLTGRASDLVGLITFARFADAIMPPTLDHKFVIDQLNHQEIATRREDDGTAIGDAISLALAGYCGRR